MRPAADVPPKMKIWRAHLASLNECRLSGGGFSEQRSAGNGGTENKLEKTERIAAVILSGGSGKRMGSDVPKQYLEILGRPVLYYSLKAFADSGVVDDIILVVGKGDISYCREEIVEKWNISGVSRIVEGGRERYDSVCEGLRAVEEAAYVLIHDGARPLVTAGVIRDSVQTAKIYGACVAGMPVKDTIKIADGEQFAAGTPDRSLLWQVQTPQTFSYPMIRAAYEKMKMVEEHEPAKWGSMHITDDAMVAETFAGVRVKLIPGGYENIKITTPEDLILAEALLRHRQNH